MHDGNIPEPEKDVIKHYLDTIDQYLYCFNDAGIITVDECNLIYVRIISYDGAYITAFLDYLKRLIAIHDTYKLYTLHHGVFVSDVYYCLNHFGFTDPISDNCYELI